MSGNRKSVTRPDTGALAGLRVLDLTDDSGRVATKLLAEAGADVLCIGRGSHAPPMRDATAGGLLDCWYDAGKLAVDVDLLVETERPGRLGPAFV